MNDQAALLAVTTRSGHSESAHYGQVAICDVAGRIVRSFGDPSQRSYMRSSAKPLQAITAISHGADKKFGWTDEELAVICASHSAEPSHRALVRSVLAKANLTTADLQCGPHPPIDNRVREELQRMGRSPTRIHSNCSGKHSGMLACCQAASWPIATYRDANHPLQVANLRTLARFSGIADEEVATGTDGCGVPSFYVPVRAMATAFCRLANPTDLSDADREAAERVFRAMTGNPNAIAGTGRFNTLLGEFAGENLIAKSGAEGVICLGLPGQGLGLAVKVSDGSARAHAAIVARLLEDLLPDLDWPRFLESANPPLLNTRGEEFGRIEPAFAE